jgi:hypothetical protein
MLALTDKRVQCDAAPFDHPSLTVFHGHTAKDKTPRDGKADDIKATLPAVGATGYGDGSGYCLPNRRSAPAAKLAPEEGTAELAADTAVTSEPRAADGTAARGFLLPHWAGATWCPSRTPGKRRRPAGQNPASTAAHRARPTPSTPEPWVR